MFCALLGTLAGNLVLTLGAVGGCYIGGGIVPGLGSFFTSSHFRDRFEDKGRFADYLSRVPTYVIRSKLPAFVGLATAFSCAGTEVGSGIAAGRCRPACPDSRPHSVSLSTSSVWGESDHENRAPVPVLALAACGGGGGQTPTANTARHRRAQRNRSCGRHCQQRRRADRRAGRRARADCADCDRADRCRSTAAACGRDPLRTDVRVHAAWHLLRSAGHSDVAVRSHAGARWHPAAAVQDGRNAIGMASRDADEHGLEQRDGAGDGLLTHGRGWHAAGGGAWRA